MCLLQIRRLKTVINLHAKAIFFFRNCFVFPNVMVCVLDCLCSLLLLQYYLYVSHPEELKVKYSVKTLTKND